MKLTLKCKQHNVIFKTDKTDSNRIVLLNEDTPLADFIKEHRECGITNNI
jgi:hypothetical protein